ncbi:MAG: hypothetical protein KBT19_00975 [Lachnospiraceae bacterium]|nr:hypothetical protein [Candidatus Colinaster equi]
MIIKNSSINMSSAREYTEHSYSTKETLETNMNDIVATLDLSENASHFKMSDLAEKIKDQEKENRQAQKEREVSNLSAMIARQKASEAANADVKNEDVDCADGLIEVLRRILAALRGEKFEPSDWPRKIRLEQAKARAMSMTFAQSAQICVSSSSVSALDMRTSANSEGGNLWTNVTATTTTMWEKEDTVFASVGKAVTADGREIDFNVEVAMSRSFAGIFKNVDITQEKRVCTDPLTINVGADVASISDKKYRFDLNCDGVEEEISFAVGGSGFVTLDKNGDGKVNDGSELFGAKTGDGFAELAEYDADGNGWIDEADDVFARLKIWQKDEEGNDRIISLKDAGVGAIFLGNVGTDFTLRDAAGNVKGAVRKTGIYLKENGDVGAIQHVDLAL